MVRFLRGRSYILHFCFDEIHSLSYIILRQKDKLFHNKNLSPNTSELSTDSSFWLMNISPVVWTVQSTPAVAINCDVYECLVCRGQSASSRMESVSDCKKADRRSQTEVHFFSLSQFPICVSIPKSFSPPLGIFHLVSFTMIT